MISYSFRQRMNRFMQVVLAVKKHVIRMVGMNITAKFFLVLLLSGFASVSSWAQSNNIRSWFSDVALLIDTSTFSLNHNTIPVNGENQLYFRYDNNQSVCEVKLFPLPERQKMVVRVLESGDYQMIDSLVNMNGQYFRFKVKFNNIPASQFLQFTFGVKAQADSSERLVSLHLFPNTNTFVKFYPGTDELFIGEEKIFELSTNNMANVRLTNEWTSGLDIDYMLDEQYGQLRLHLLPHNLGKRRLQVALQTVKPFLDSALHPIYALPLIQQDFNVKTSRLAFLNIDKKEITLDDNSQKNGVEVQVDDNRALVIGKTYRIEEQENPGGALIAELYTRNNLANNRVLCVIRPYYYHRQSEGYLYIKDGDDARFITNINITPKTAIKKITVLHEGGDWTDNLGVYPGENITVKIEGEGLHKAKFSFEDLPTTAIDSAIMGENMIIYKLSIPLTFSKKRISIYNYADNTGFALNVKEYQVPRPFDYLQVNYGDIDRTVSSLKSPVLYPHAITDITFDYIPRRIDEDPKMLYGKQYLKIDVTVMNSKNQLVEMKTIDNIVVCPGDNSPRFNNYDKKDCSNDVVSLNSYLSTKTFDLDDWSKIELNIQEKKEKYTADVYTKKIDIYLQKTYKFDMDVSFPGGLITVYRQPIPGDTTGRTHMAFGSLSGISMAIMAQFSFYDPEKIAKFKPYKIGAGFLALNAFNFSSGDVNRDVGLVIIGSIYPVNREAKLRFPIYIGGGYLLKAHQPFFLIGPGISVSL